MAEVKSRKTNRKPSQTGCQPQSGYTVQASVWIEKNGQLYLGGSISAAARSMGLGYRNAWLWIDSMNQLAPSPLVIKVKGGPGGGYAQLTEEGHKALKSYKKLRKKMEATLESLQPE